MPRGSTISPSSTTHIGVRIGSYMAMLAERPVVTAIEVDERLAESARAFLLTGP